MCQRLPHSHPVIGIPQFITAFGEAQGKWSDTMSQLEETLGGLRIIKAFIAEKRMVDRFAKCSNE